MTTFKALLLKKSVDGFSAEIQHLSLSDLPAGDVLVRVNYSDLNYKDALAVLDLAPIVRQFPMVPGIDLAGVVEASSDDRFQPGDRVFATGWGLGEKYWGGFAELARLKADWLMALPTGLNQPQVMQIGTAGFTAMLCVMALENHGVTPESGEILVTGATGGVGSWAITLLSQLGYQVVASTGRAEQLGDYLTQLGSSRVIDRLETTKRPLNQTQWAGAIDTVGGHTLAAALSQMQYGASIAACGLAGSADLSTSVYPFILRGVNLLGIDSVMQSRQSRQAVWQRLAQRLTDDIWPVMRSNIIPLADVESVAQRMAAGQSCGRTIIAV